MLRFHELAASPNNTKLRMALRFKEIAFEAVPVHPAKREGLVELSGQSLTPVIEDRGIVLNDSEAILQYLDANYPDAPLLCPVSAGDRRACDAWKLSLDRKAAKAWMPLFFFAIGRGEDPGDDARQAWREALAWLESEIGGDGHYVNAEWAICDLRAAEWATYAFPGPGLLARVPYWNKFALVFAADAADYPKLLAFLAPWQERLA